MIWPPYYTALRNQGAFFKSDPYLISTTYHNLLEESAELERKDRVNTIKLIAGVAVAGLAIFLGMKILKSQ